MATIAIEPNRLIAGSLRNTTIFDQYVQVFDAQGAHAFHSRGKGLLFGGFTASGGEWKNRKDEFRDGEKARG